MYAFARASRIVVVLLFCAASLTPPLPVRAAAAQVPGGWPARWQTDPTFEEVWARTDAPVAGGSVARSWLWGPEPFAVANEQFAESSTGLRLVEYLDKGRMEQNDPASDRGSPWYVTSGLLVREMVLGQIQVGAAQFLPRAPATLPIAGGAQSEGTPTFPSFAPHLGQVGDRRGQVNGQFMAADGTVSRVEPAGDPALFVAREYDEVSGHNIPAVFAEWTRRSGPVYEKGLTADGPLMDSLFVLGRPVTEAYWVDATIGGRTSRALVQLFERRVLTYNPDNPPDWRVEMGNVGRAYFSWRYGDSPPAPAVAGRASGSGALVGGWNWPCGVPVAVRVEMAGAEAPVGGPVDAQPDESGYFSVVIPGSAALSGAIASRANLRVVAAGAGGMVSLPVSPSPQIAPGSLEGMLSHVERDGANLLLTLTAADGEHTRMVLPPGARVRFAEGGAAPPEAVEPGAYAAAAGTEQNGVVHVARLDLLSVSGGGSVVGYTWLNGTKLRVSGRGWPGGQAVAFGTGTAAGEHARFASLTADSRGNLVGTVTLPGLSAAATARTWLSASTVSSGGIARVLVPVVSLGTPTSRPLPGMFAYSARGGQVAAGPLQCPESGCAEGRALDLPSRPLTVSLGETLALRPRWGADPLISRAPFAFTGELYRLTGAASSAFVPSGPPIHSTGQLPGRPLSVALPNGMEQGTYALILRASWPGASGVLVHSFLLEVR